MQPFSGTSSKMCIRDRHGHVVDRAVHGQGADAAPGEKEGRDGVGVRAHGQRALDVQQGGVVHAVQQGVGEMAHEALGDEPLRGASAAACIQPVSYTHLKTLRQLDDSLPVEIIPGITSFQAAAARTRTILCESHEALCIIPGIRDEESLTQTLEQADSAVILKAYRNFPAIVSSLRRSGRLEGGLMASHVEQPEELSLIHI